MAYRDLAAAKEEILATFVVKTTKGSELVGALLGLSLIFVVVLGVSVFAGTPPVIAPYVWTFAVAAIAFGAPAIWFSMKRRRMLHFVRVGEQLKLVIPDTIELRFPLTMSGGQATIRQGAIPIYYLRLRLEDDELKAITLREVRGMIHGPVDGWFASPDISLSAMSFDVGVDDAARIRRLVEKLGRRISSAPDGFEGEDDEDEDDEAEAG